LKKKAEYDVLSQIPYYKVKHKVPTISMHLSTKRPLSFTNCLQKQL